MSLQFGSQFAVASNCSSREIQEQQVQKQKAALRAEVAGRYHIANNTVRICEGRHSNPTAL
jgi:hypothetical protein